MSALAVLCLTDDDALWARWSTLKEWGWSCSRIHSAPDVSGQRVLLLVDMAAPAVSTLDGTQLRALFGVAQVVAAHDRPDAQEAARLLGAGAYGCVHTYAPLQVLDAALCAVSAGRQWLGSSLLSALLQHIQTVVRFDEQKGQVLLSPFERDVVRQSIAGRSKQDIVQLLACAPQAVDAALAQAFRQYGVSDRLALAVHACELQD